MFGQNNYPMYNGYTNPMAPVQQRLAQMEAQYTPYPSGNVNIYPRPQEPYTASQGPQAGFLKCRMVSSIDEVKAAMIDLDGGVNIFTDLGNHKIYTKQINLDGTATINTYTQEPPNNMESVTPVGRREFEEAIQTLGQRLENLENIRRENVSNAKPHANDESGKLRK